MKRKQLLPACLFSLFAANAAAADFDITVTNLTQGIHFTPLIVAAHNSDSAMFKVATQASGELQAMAEGGDISGLQSVLTAAGADIMANPAEGLMAPSSMTSFSMSNSDGNNYLSLTAMMLPTNDGFVGLSGWMIPQQAGTYTIWLNAYDAGTEANDEMIVGGSGGAPGTAGIPAAPGGNGGSNGSGVMDANAMANIHVHRGALGDDDANGGKSDLDNRVHRWLNPVAKVTVTVK